MAARVLEESAQRVSDGVTELLRKQPFFGSLALRLPLRADPSRETLASDGHEIRYSPRWVAATDAHVIETAMARVVMACALKHHTRRGERDPERWQMASQLVTHALIRDAGFTLPPDAEALDGVSVEEAYDRLPEPQEDGSGSDGESPPAGGAMAAAAAGQPSGAGDGDDDSSDDTADAPDSPGDDDDSGAPDDSGGQDQGDPDDGRRDEDSPSDAPPSHDPSGTGEIMDAGARGDGNAGEGESPVDVTAEEQAWDEAMHQAMNLARAEGKLPGGVEETVRNAHASTLDWRSLLRRYMTDAARRDYSWSFPNRRFIDSGLYLPSIRSEGMDAIAVIIDTPPRTCRRFATSRRLYAMPRLERRCSRAGLPGRGGCAGACGGGSAGAGLPGRGRRAGRRPLRQRLARTPRVVAGYPVALQWPNTRPAPLTLPPDIARSGACLRTSGRTGTLKKGHHADCRCASAPGGDAMNKADLAAHVAAQVALPKVAADHAVSAAFAAIADALARDEAVAITGFGTVSTRSRAARQGATRKRARASPSPPPGRRRSRPGRSSAISSNGRE